MLFAAHPLEEGQTWQEAHLWRQEADKGGHGTRTVFREFRQLPLLCCLVAALMCYRLVSDVLYNNIQVAKLLIYMLQLFSHHVAASCVCTDCNAIYAALWIVSSNLI